MKENLWYLLFFIFSIQHINSSGQARVPSFDHLTIDNGLSQSTVFSIVQDSKGFIWIGTRDGLNRYDSHDIKVYRKSETNRTGLPGNVINCLLVDSKGRMWVGTSSGLCIYDSAKDLFSEVSGLTNNNITAIYEDKDKNIWAGTRNGLNLITPQAPFKITHYFHDPKNSESLSNGYIRTIYQDRAGMIWVGTNEGLSRFKYLRGSIAIKCVHYSNIPSKSINDNIVNVVAEGEGGMIWIGTEKGGLIMYDPIKNEFFSSDHMSPNPDHQMLIKRINHSVRVIKRDLSGLYWIGTIAGLYEYDPVQKTVHEFVSNSDNTASMSDNSVRAICIDRNNSKWIGTYYGGVNFYSSMTNQFDHFRQSGKNSPLRFKIASAMYEDEQNNIWLSTDGGGLIFWDRKKNTFESFKHSESESSLSHGNVKCIYPDGREGLWIGTFDGLNYFSFNTRRFTRYYSDIRNPNSLPNDRIYDIKADRNGFLWIATLGGGLCKFDKKNRKFESFHFRESDPNALNSDFLTCLYFDSKDRLWIGSSTGLTLMFPGGSFRRVNGFQDSYDSPNGKFILFVHEDHLKRIWIGTRGNGLFLYDEHAGKYRNYTVEDGLPGNNIYGILEDKKGNLWLSTENGLSRFDPVQQKFRNYSKNDGLICKEFNFNSYMKDHTGRMYFGGYNGIVTFHPDSILENTSVPPVVFTKLRLFKTEVSIGDKSKLLKQPLSETKELKFRYNQNVFSIEFAVLNFINPDNNKYAYILEGFEKKWNFVDNPVATYMNLKPGTYRFLAKGSNNDDEWNSTPIIVKIKVMPPPWKSWWAFLLYAIIIMTGFMYIMRLIKGRLKLEQSLYLEQLENKKQNELTQSKLRFFTNISHELRTPLTLIISPVESLVNSTSDIHIRKQLIMIQSNANRLLRLLNQLLDFRKQETKNLKLKVAEGNIVKFIREIELAFQEYARLKNISLNFESDSDEIKVWYDREEMEKVFFNLLSNAFKFTHNGGAIDIRLRGTAEHVEISVEDNGIGIPAEHLEKIFDSFYQVENLDVINHGFGIGLALTKAIIELHHGTIKVESVQTENKKGTKFTILLKTGKSEFSDDQIVSGYTNSEQVDSYLSLETESLSLSQNVLNAKVKEDYLILVVEDNQEIRSYIRSRLEQVYKVKEAADGKEAWEIASKILPDIVISDVMMPVMDGITLTKRIKSDERTCHIPVILVTARNR